MNKLKLFCVMITFFTLSCGYNKHNEALNIGNKFMDLIKEDKYKEALLFSNRDIINKPDFDLITDKWTNSFIMNRKVLGDMKSYEIIELDMENSFKSKEIQNGTYYHLRYSVIYSNYPANIDLMLYKPFSNNNISIHNFRIESEGFNK